MAVGRSSADPVATIVDAGTDDASAADAIAAELATLLGHDATRIT